MPTIYVHDENHNRYEGMTREQIINAIVQAVEQGEITDLDDGFITKIKEQNGNNNIQFWIGTSAQFNALQTKDANTLYILSDDDSADDWDRIAQEVESLGDTVNNINEDVTKILDGTTRVPKATNAQGAEIADITESFTNPTHYEYEIGERLQHEGFHHIFIRWFYNGNVAKVYDAGIVYWDALENQPITKVLDFYAVMEISTLGTLSFKVGTTPSNMAIDTNVKFYVSRVQ